MNIIDFREWQMYEEKFAETLSTDYFMGNLTLEILCKIYMLASWFLTLWKKKKKGKHQM